MAAVVAPAVLENSDPITIDTENMITMSDMTRTIKIASQCFFPETGARGLKKLFDRLISMLYYIYKKRMYE